jgi:hypothetical protein
VPQPPPPPLPPPPAQSVAREARAESGGLRSEVAAASAAALRQLEGWARGELLGVAGQLKHVVSSCAAQQEQARLQFEALQQQWEGASGALDALKAEGRRVKRHVARLERKAEVGGGEGGEARRGGGGVRTVASGAPLRRSRCARHRRNGAGTPCSAPCHSWPAVR